MNTNEHLMSVPKQPVLLFRLIRHKYNFMSVLMVVFFQNNEVVFHVYIQVVFSRRWSLLQS